MTARIDNPPWRIALAALFLFATPALAAPPAVFTYSGYLQNAGGAPVTVATTLVLNVYDAATDGDVLASSTVTVTPASDGHFSAVVNLPVGALAAAPAAWLGITVQPDSDELTPRTRLTSAPYAEVVDWVGVTGKPAAFPSDWSTLAGKPTAFSVTGGACPGGQFASAIGTNGAPTCAAPSAASVDWSSVTGRPATFPSDWSTLASKPASFPVAGGTCPLGQIATGIDASGAPVCKILSGGGALFSAMDSTTAYVSIARADGATNGYLASADFAAFAAKPALGASGGLAGTATTAARSDHAHPSQGHRISISAAAMSSAPTSVLVGGVIVVPAVSLDAEDPHAAVVIPAIPASGGPSFRFKLYNAGGTARTLSTFASYTAVGVGGTVPTCKSGQSLFSNRTIQPGQVLELTGTYSSMNTCGSGAAAGVGDLFWVELQHQAGDATNVYVIGAELVF